MLEISDFGEIQTFGIQTFTVQQYFTFMERVMSVTVMNPFFSLSMALNLFTYIAISSFFKLIGMFSRDLRFTSLPIYNNNKRRDKAGLGLSLKSTIISAS